MLVRLVLVLTIVPLVELFILLWIAARIQLGPTVALVLGTGLLGAYLARREGIKAFSKVHEQLSNGIMPGEALIHGLLILVAGLLLVTPGILTDLVGFGLLITPIRTRVQRTLVSAFKDRIVRFDGDTARSFVDVVATSASNAEGCEKAPGAAGSIEGRKEGDSWTGDGL